MNMPVKREYLWSAGALALIPVVLLLGGAAYRWIDPELAAGHADYERNFALLQRVQYLAFLTSLAIAGALWLLTCLFVIRAKRRSPAWLTLAMLGPFGLAILATLSERRSTGETSSRAALSWLAWRAVCELTFCAGAWFVAYRAMVWKRDLTIAHTAVATGMTPAQVLAEQNASSGMWAFGEGLEVCFFVASIYVVRLVAAHLLSLSRPAVREPR